MAVAAGPITGGWLLEHFWWGSVFFVNVPVVIAVVIATWFVVPESREHDVAAPRLAPASFCRSPRSAALVFTIIEAPECGWLDPKTLAGFAARRRAARAFVWWELRRGAPDAAGRRSSATCASRPRASRSRRRSSLCSGSSSSSRSTSSSCGATCRSRPASAHAAGGVLDRDGAPWLAPLLVRRSAPPRWSAPASALMAIVVRVDRAALGGRHRVHRDRRPDDPARRRPRLDHGARHRVDHGLAVGRQGRRRFGGQRHHPRAGRHARRRDHRQRLQLALRRLPRTMPAARSPTAARGAGADEGVGRCGADRGRAARRRTPRRTSTRSTRRSSRASASAASSPPASPPPAPCSPAASSPRGRRRGHPVSDLG